ncbi:SH3-containing GRB2-like protein 3-interacting protein 1 isoform X8 [Neoarius graeffei]|uniref:SH3-containing GRB2-like protein 3-interacting protein 1 isoform X8 n=1 Tax=Neoarius graeffei TaxID=443677 RepID=UPI00298C4605|nr:SH3-containing GRB2-like protein 3-interacting protein 1 isoform X8 [Neoarius graeffei]
MIFMDCYWPFLGSLEIEECKSAIMMEGLKKRTRKAFGIRKKEKDTDSTGSPDREGGPQKKSNGAPNGFYGEIDWDRYNSPMVDEEGYSIRPDEDGATPKDKSHFFSSSESEEEEDHHKKFKIKIKPLLADNAEFVAPSVDELKASIGNIALSPSPLRRSPGLPKRDATSEEIEIARPRRSVPTITPVSVPAPAPVPEPPSSKKSPVPEDAIALFGPPLETAFEEQRTEDVKAEDTSPNTHKPSIADLDNIFGPADSPKPADSTADKWVCFNDESPQRPALPEALAPSLPKSSPPLPEEPAPPLPPTEPPRTTTPSPPAPILSPKDPSPPKVPLPPDEVAPPPPDEPLKPNAESAQHIPDTEARSGSAKTPPSALEITARTIPPPLALNQEDKNNPEEGNPKESPNESSASPKEIDQGPRSTPPPPPPPTYRAVVSSPGPTPAVTSGGSGSGSSSPARPGTPLTASSPPPPPPPPRPPSRPKLAPGKGSVGDANRPFSPPVHSSSPPPLAPLARAESTSSISSTNSLSAASTPTVGKELSVSVSDDVFVDKLPSFERRADLLAETDQPSLVWFDRGKFYLTFEGCSRGPSPLTMGAQDTLPVAAAFTETVNAYFKGTDPSKCVVKITGEMVLSFPAGITRHFANNPTPAVLTFSITNYSHLEHVLPNPQLLCCDATQSKPNSKEFWVNMPNLMTHLKKVAEQKPQATYYNVDMLKYQVSAQGLQSTPLNLAMSWRCEPTSTDLRIDYRYNGNAMTTPVALNNVQFLVPVDGGVGQLQAVLPPAVWNAEQQRILWKIPDISQKSENGGVGSLLARFQLTNGPSKPAPLAVQFTSEGSTLSGCDIELLGSGYRFSLIKKRFAAGKYLADN